ncbi:MAG: hypothetical protein IJ532_07610 [Alphaproteobacteria bacterium]|nr:hypothetical protein [Alphaproteobacteria bacterium]
MKKIFIITAVCFIVGCSELSQFMPSSSGSTSATDSSWRSKMQSCMMSEAQSKFQAGTLFTNSISATADELVSTCTKKLALQSLGISDEAKSSAESIITNLKNLSSAQ